MLFAFQFSFYHPEIAGHEAAVAERVVEAVVASAAELLAVEEDSLAVLDQAHHSAVALVQCQVHHSAAALVQVHLSAVAEELGQVWALVELLASAEEPVLAQGLASAVEHVQAQESALEEQPVSAEELDRAPESALEERLELAEVRGRELLEVRTQPIVLMPRAKINSVVF